MIFVKLFKKKKSIFGKVDQLPNRSHSLDLEKK